MKRTETSVQFGTWLSDARASEKDKGVNHRELACYGSKLTPYVQNQLAPALQDMETLYAALPSVTEDEEKQRAFWEDFRPEYVQRIRVALDSIGAALTAVGCTEDELASAVPDATEPDASSETPEGEDQEPKNDETVLLDVVEVRQAVEASEK